MKNIIQKWSPILDALKITDLKKRRFMAVYAEHHQNLEPSEYFDPLFVTESNVDLSNSDGGKQSDIAQNLLPMSMKILSKLNLDGKRIQIKEKLPIQQFRIDISTLTDLQMKKFNEMNFDVILMVENALINILVDNINEELKTKDNFYIQNMACAITIKNEGTIEVPKSIMTLYARYRID